MGTHGQGDRACAHMSGSLNTNDWGEGRVDVGLTHGECSKSTAEVSCSVVSIVDGALSFLS